MFAILNVGRRTVPFHDLSSFVSQRDGAAQKPSILPVGAADAHLLLERLTTDKARVHSVFNSIPIFRMNSKCPDFLHFSKLRQAGIFNPASIPKLNGAIRCSDPSHRRNRLNGFAKFFFLSPQLLHSELIQPPKECQKCSHTQQPEPTGLVESRQYGESHARGYTRPDAIRIGRLYAEMIG